MSQFACLLFLAFLCKVSAVGCVTYFLEKKYNQVLGSIIGAWCFVELFLFLQIFILSTFQALGTIQLWISMIGLNFFLIIAVIIHAIKEKNKHYQPANISAYLEFNSNSAKLAFIVITGIFIFLAYRSIYFFDTTWDSLVYELTRILFYAHAHSVFVLQPTLAFNIFSNEWNGELNALFYLVAANNDQASSFGNVEIWLLLCLSYAWLLENFNTPKFFTLLGGLILASAPVWLGLATTVKGDLLMVATLSAGFGFVLNFYTNANKTLNYLFAVAALSLACGSKILALPLAGLLLIQVTFSFITQKQHKFFRIKILCMAIILIVIANARYIVNIYHYGNPLKHIESFQFSFHNFFPNLLGIFQSFFDLFYNQWKFSTFSLNMGLGYLGFALAASIMVGIWSNRRNKHSLSQSQIVAMTLLAIVLLFLLLNFPWYPWSFRYFAPFCFFFVAFLFAKSVSQLKEGKNTTLISLVWVCLISINMFFSLRDTGERMPVSFQTSMQQVEMQRKVAFNPYLWDGPEGLSFLNYNSPYIKNVLVFNNVNAVVVPFFGEHHSKNVTLVDSLDNLYRKLEKHSYDVIAITPGCPANALILDCSNPNKLPTLPGYVLKINNPIWLVYTLRT